MMNSEAKVIYFDNNATTAIDPAVFAAMEPFLKDYYGNPSSIYSFGGRIAACVEKARTQVAELLGAVHRDQAGHATEVIFTSCGTEGDNAAILSALSTNTGRHKIVTSKVEHPAVLNLCKELDRRGYTVVTVPVDGKGRLDMEFLRNAVDRDTAVVSIMWANNEIGNIYPVQEIGEIAHFYGALFHTDAVQAVGSADGVVENADRLFKSFWP